MSATTARLAFTLPPDLEASEPPEARGLRRDEVRMLVARRSAGELTDATFTQLPTHLAEGDVVVVNTSGTLPAAADALAHDGTHVVIHLSTHLRGSRWVVELRRPAGRATERWEGPPPAAHLHLGEGAYLDLVEPYRGDRLWVADLRMPLPVLAWLAVNGRAIRYGYVDRPHPLADYQNVYALHPGSAEMASAGRPFSTELITRLVAKGVDIVPVVLHTGVASLEADETPYPERVIVSPASARRIESARQAGGRVIAVGTTAVRAIESAVDAGGAVRPLHGWTDLVVTPERGVRVVDGLLTGWHEPEASHLLMLEAIAGRALLERSYARALDEGYLWHEFGDVHLVLP